MRLLLDTHPLKTGHEVRGVGLYTRELQQALTELGTVELVSDLTQKPDIIHYPYFDFAFPTLPWHHPAPVVLTIHDTIPLIYPEYYPLGIKGTLNFWRQKHALGRVSHILTDSEASRRDITRYLHVSTEKISVVPLAGNPALKPASATSVAEARKKYQLPTHYVLYVGDINYNKNIPQLIKSLKYLPEQYSLVCVGKQFRPQPIPEWQWIETQIALSDVSARVHCVSELGSTATDDLAALYSGAAVYVQPSLSEGFGLPVLEAMQCRTPVVTTNVASLPEVGGAHAVYSEQTDAESLAASIRTVLEWSQSHRTQWVRSAAQWAKTFSWARTARETFELYTKVLT